MMFTGGGRKKIGNGQHGSQRNRSRAHEVCTKHSYRKCMYIVYTKYVRCFFAFDSQPRSKNQSSSSSYMNWGSGNGNASGSSSTPLSLSTLYSDSISRLNQPSTSSTSSGGTNLPSYYQTSISDLGYSSLVSQNTNTRVRSITNRRGAVKHQKYICCFGYIIACVFLKIRGWMLTIIYHSLQNPQHQWPQICGEIFPSTDVLCFL